MNSDPIVRKLTTIMAADVVGYSKLMSEDEEGTLRTFRLYRQVIDGLIDKHGGRIFNTAGDAVLAEFTSAVEGVRCSISIQEELNTRNAELVDEKKIRLRIGINVGDVMIEGADLFGDGVNVAARLEGLAAPGGICISSSTFEQVKNKLSIGFEDMGPQEVKNIPHPVGAFQIMSGPISVSSGTKAVPTDKSASGWRNPAIAALAFLFVAAGTFYGWQKYSSRSVALSSLPASFSTDSMKMADINRLVPGISIRGISSVSGKPFTIRILAGGIAEIELLRSGELAGTIQRETGKWWAENYRFCMQFSKFGKGRKRCPRIVRENERVYATRGNGEALEWVLSKP